MQSKFKYIYNGKEVGKEDFYNLTVEAFKWFQGNSINAIDSSSVLGGEKEDKVINSTLITRNEERRQKLENLRKQIAFNKSLEGKPFSKILDILNCDMEEYVKNIEVKDPETVTPLKFIKSVEKEDVGKRKGAYKETKGKLFYELDWGFIKQMAERMASNKKEDKYELFNWKKPMTSKGIEDLKQATLRHLLEVLEGNYEDDGRAFGHLEAVADNVMMINYQLKNK